MAEVVQETAATEVVKTEDVPCATNGEEVSASEPTEAVTEGGNANGETQDSTAATQGTTQDTGEVKKEEDLKSDPKDDDTKDREEKHDQRKRRDGPRKSFNDNKFKKPKFNEKIASRFDDMPESDDADDIRRQVEFYFSDSNLPTDAFLLKQTGGHLNLPVPLRSIHSFKRMQHFQPYSAVRDAVAQSKLLDIDDNDDITRKIPLDDKYTDDPHANSKLQNTSSMGRSIYVKGFSEEVKSSQLDIENFFDIYGPIQSVRLRRAEDGEFKGSVFVEFEDEDLMNKFLELDPKPQYDGKELTVETKAGYVARKNQDIRDGKVRPRSQDRRSYGGRGGHRGGGRGGGRGRGRGGNDRRGRDHHRDHRRRDDSRDRSRSRSPYRKDKDLDKDDWKQRRDRFQKDDKRDHRDRRDRDDGRRDGDADDYGRKRRRYDDDDSDREESDKREKRRKSDDQDGKDVKKENVKDEAEKVDAKETKSEIKKDEKVEQPTDTAQEAKTGAETAPATATT